MEKNLQPKSTNEAFQSQSSANCEKIIKRFFLFISFQIYREIDSANCPRMSRHSHSWSACCFITTLFVRYRSRCADFIRWPTWIFEAISSQCYRGRFAFFRFKSFSSPTIDSRHYRMSWVEWATWRSSMPAVINSHIYQLDWANWSI